MATNRVGDVLHLIPVAGLGPPTFFQFESARRQAQYFMLPRRKFRHSSGTPINKSTPDVNGSEYRMAGGTGMVTIPTGAKIV